MRRLSHGYLTDCDGRIEAAERQVTTGAYLQQYTRSWERQPRFSGPTGLLTAEVNRKIVAAASTTTGA